MAKGGIRFSPTKLDCEFCIFLCNYQRLPEDPGVFSILTKKAHSKSDQTAVLAMDHIGPKAFRPAQALAFARSWLWGCSGVSVCFCRVLGSSGSTRVDWGI